MAYQKTSYRNIDIADVSRAALDHIEESLRIGYHAVAVRACAEILQIMGEDTAFWPFFESSQDVARDFCHNGYHFYTSLGAAEDLEAWDTPPYQQGVMTAYAFNAVDEYLRALDQDFFTVEASDAFSLGAWVNFDTSSADSCIMSKWDETNAAERREWFFTTDNTGYLTMLIYDETNGAEIGREYQTRLPTHIWQFVVATYDGGTDAANIAIWVDGVQVDDASPADDAGFASMVNQTVGVRCGSFENSLGDEDYLFNGSIAMPFFTLKELSEHEIYMLMQIGKGLLDLDLPGGQPK